MGRVITDKVLEIFCAVILFGVFLFVIYSNYLMSTKNEIASGATALWNREDIWLPAVFEIVIYLGLSFTQKYPQKFNYPVKVTESNKARLYSLGIRGVLLVKLFVVVLFSYLLLCAVGVTTMSLFIMLPLSIVLAMVIPILLMVKMSKVR